MIVLTDTISFIETAFDANGKLPRTADGYAKMECPVARSGIQEYLAAEMGPAFKDRDPMSVVRVYRPDSVIFGDASMASYAHKPLTNDHPPEAVTADNWKQYAIGHTGDEVKQQGKYVRIPMMMSDAAAISLAESGKVEWSAGYSVSFDVQSGTTDDGQAYDAIVTGQKINHIALVDRGRAGPECRIGDDISALDNALKENRQMAEVKMQDGGVPFVVADATAEAIVNKIVQARDKATTDLTDAQSQVAALTTQVSTKDAEIATLRQSLEDAKVTPAQLRDAAAAYAKVLTDAKRIAPTVTIADDATETAVKSAVVSAKLGDAAKSWTEAQIDTSFATLAAQLPAQDSIADVIKDGGGNVVDFADAEKKAYEANVARLTGKKAS